MILRLLPSPGHAEVQCPYCDTDLAPDWNTEYGDPIDGRHAVKCPTCDMEFRLDVKTSVRYTANKKY